MSRNNDDRLGAAPDATPPPIQVEENTPATANTNPPGQGSNGLNFVIPTEFVHSMLKVTLCTEQELWKLST
mgnify:CR=1 FL=1